METPDPAPEISQTEVLGVFSPSDQPSTPLTTTEVADRLDEQEATVKDKLESLTDGGHLQSRQIDAPTRIWWPAETGETVVSTAAEQSEQFRRFIDAVQDYAIFLLDPDGSVASWNDGAERIKGYEEEEILGQHVSTFYTEADIANDVPEENLTAAREQGRVEDEGWRVRKDGSQFWAHVVITAIRDDEGSLRGFTKVTRDMTEQRESEQRIREERDLSEPILETVSVSLTVLTPDGQFLQANSRALDRLGITEEELDQITVDSWTIYDENGEPIAPEETPWRRAAERGAPVTDFRCQVELPDIGRRWLSINAAPIDLDAQANDRIILAVDDITEQVTREQALRRERNQTEKLLRTAPVAIAVQNASGETLLANERAQEVLGLSEQEIIGEPENVEEWTTYDADGDVLSSDQRPSARVHVTGEAVYDEEIAIEKPTGERTWLSVNATPVFGSDGDIDRVIVAGEDITQLKRREQHLQQRTSELEAELSEVLGRISDAFYALDETWRFNHINDRAEELLQHPREQLIGERLWDVFPEAKDTPIWPRFRSAMETMEPVSFEYQYDELDLWLQITAYPSETGLSVYFHDITERKEREQELERYRAIVETVNDGIYAVDEEGRFTMVNETYVEMTGYSRDELLGSHVSLVVDEEIVDSAREIEEELVAGEQEKMMIEAEMKRADGGTLPAEAAFTLLRSDDAYERIGVVRDISERRAQQRALEESERRHRTLVENFPDGAVAMFDEDLRFTAVGGQLLDQVGLAPGDRIGKHISEAYPEEIVNEYGQYFQAVFEDEANTFEATFHDRHLYTQTLPVRNADDDIIAGMLVAQDITERIEYRQQLEETIEKLEESNDRLEQFAYIASHDLQEPLRMVTSYLQLLEERYDDELDEDARDFIDSAVDGAERMQTMVEALLLYSRLDTDAEPLERTEPEIIVDSVLDQLQLQIEESDAEVLVEDLPTVEADENQLEQVFQNLVSNAIKYRDDDPPHIVISADRVDGMCQFHVADNGIGIDPAYTEQIFEVFKRLHSHKDYPGTGIGLALCKKIVERHGGDIWVESEPGEGSTFSFTIPLADRPDD